MTENVKSLEEITAALRKLRDVKLDIKQKEEQLERASKQRYHLERAVLPDLFNEARIDHLGLPAEGNLPSFDAKLKPYLHANISAKWPPEKRAAAYEWLEKHGGGDLIKTIITILLPRDKKSAKLRKKIIALLKELKVEATIDLGVHWASLTSFLAELDDVVPADLLGADIGQVVEMKERNVIEE